LQIEGIILDIDYLIRDAAGIIRLTVKSSDGNAYELFDRGFRPYFYLEKESSLKDEFILSKISGGQQGSQGVIVENVKKRVAGVEKDLMKIITGNPLDIPRLSSSASAYGKTYEYDIPFAKRYAIDNDLAPITNYLFEVYEENGKTLIKSIKPSELKKIPELNTMWFDIEVYNPLGIPRASSDPVIMISFSYKSHGREGSSVMTYKKIAEDFVITLKNESELISMFMKKIEELDIDIISGYNSANFDIKYLIDRSKVLGVRFSIGRFEGETRLEKHGLLERVKIPGRVHVDMYNVVKFVSIVGASESILKLSSHTLKNVYEAITGDVKTNVDKVSIFKLWDGTAEELDKLAVYNLSDSKALQKVYETFAPITIELSRVTGDMLSDTAVSTTGQLVDYLLMRNAHNAGEIVPNKPDEKEIERRIKVPIEGAYVKTPDPGVYDRLVIFDFRGLYPSIIISYNIDTATVCTDCPDYYESPIGTRFDKNRRGIMPLILKYLVEQRKEIKKQYKKNMDDVFLGARSSALKILSNSFYGYLGYARSRWYSRECASSVTAYGRQYIKDTILAAEREGFRVLYGDTDSVVLLLGDKTKEETLRFLKGFNEKLPEDMELELEDFYTRGVFVGKKVKGGETGAKKKYALISESGRIKIRGFELVRRDWSKVARETQRKVLETILKEGSPKLAADIVKNVIKELREGKMKLSELAISTQLRKSIGNYDSTSPELEAAKKAVKMGLKRKDEVEHAVISYVITKHGSSISDKAELEEFAKDYDPDYYINNQVIPATMKILRELNFDEEELKGIGSQKKL
jgi:DNA polymerase I